MHTQRTLAGRMLRPGRARTKLRPAVSWAVSRLWPAVSLSCRKCVVRRTLPCRSSPRSRYKFVSQQATCRVSCRAYHVPTRPCRSACTTVSWPVLRHTQRPGYARALPAVSQGLSAVSWPLLAVSWPLQLCPAALCHDTIHCIVTQMGSNPSSLCFFFFFSLTFFFFIPTT